MESLAYKMRLVGFQNTSWRRNEGGRKQTLGGGISSNPLGIRNQPILGSWSPLKQLLVLLVTLLLVYGTTALEEP